MSSTLKLDRRRPLKDGTFPIVINVGYSRKMLLATGISAFEKDWNDTAQMVTGPGSIPKNTALKAMLSTTIARILDLRAMGVFDNLDNKQLRAMLKDTSLTAPPEQKSKHSLGAMFETVIGTKAQRTAKIYASTLARLRLYADVDKVSFDDINRLWLDGFVASMSDLSTNTRSLHMRNLRAVNNYAIDCDITKNYPFRRYRMPLQTATKRALKVDVIRDLARMDFGHNNVYRDLFMLTFYLCGINFIDLCSLTCVEEGRVNYTRSKTHKPYSVKVEPEAAAIIERLKGETHLLYMLDNHVDHTSYYRQLRRGLKKVRLEFNERHPDKALPRLSTYFARHSWATIAAGLDIPKETIAAGLGHEMGNNMTAIYIDFDRSKVDAANRRVIDWVLYGR